MVPEYEIAEPGKILSPGLIFFVDIISQNIESALSIAGSPGRIWPHVKTHKTAEIVDMMIKSGITHFKCATITEAEMLGKCGAAEVLFAYPLVGPNIARFAKICSLFPATGFFPIVDHPASLKLLSNELAASQEKTEVLLDIDVGMGRTGMPPGEGAESLYRLIQESPGLKPGGLHVYDGHNHQQDPGERQEAADGVYSRVKGFWQRLLDKKMPVPRVILGGTPTFPCYAHYPDVGLSPGTFALHDWAYQSQFPDLPFVPAALVLTRVISRISPDCITLDLGSKAISSDRPGVRGVLLQPIDAKPLSQSEEHWSFRIDSDLDLGPGDLLYVLPNHICTTVNLHDIAYVVDAAGVQRDSWKITARSRGLGV